MRIKIIAILIGTIFVLGSGLNVYAMERDEDKKVSGQFDYFFNDRTMNKRHYGNLQNETKAKDENDMSAYRNNTNVNHLVAQWIKLRKAFDFVLNRYNVKLTEKENEQINKYINLNFEDPSSFNILGHVGVLGTQFFAVDEKVYEKVLKKMFKVMGEVKITEKDFIKAKIDIKNIIDAKLQDRNDRKDEIVQSRRGGYEKKEHFKQYNKMLEIVRKEVKDKASFKDVKAAADHFECKKELRKELRKV